LPKKKKKPGSISGGDNAIERPFAIGEKQSRGPVDHKQFGRVARITSSESRFHQASQFQHYDLELCDSRSIFNNLVFLL
jgi:hypothetical protein